MNNTINTNQTQLADDVMRRVRAVHTMRRVWHSPIWKGAFCTVCAVAAFMLVSIPHIYANVTQLPGFWAGMSYIVTAFAHTHHIAVQAAVLLGAAAGVWLAVDMVRNLAEGRDLKAFHFFRIRQA